MTTFTIPIEEVTYDDAKRQRSVLEDIESLCESIKRLGLINPIVLDEANNLLAGRRRLEAHRRLGLENILARRFSDLSSTDKRLLELDENLRRVDLIWQDTAKAIYEIHTLKGEVEGSWTQQRTAEYLGLTDGWVAQNLIVARSLLKDNDLKVKMATTLAMAAEYLRRRKDLVLKTALSKGFSDAPAPEDYEEGQGEEDAGLLSGLFAEETTPEGVPRPLIRPTLSIPSKPAKYRIHQADFHKWIDEVPYPQWNLIHCDFPYGINFDKSDAAISESHESQYPDTEEVFWTLTHSLLKNQDRLILSSAHMVFWFSMKYYERLRETLEAYRWFVVPQPLIWHKSDGSGIAPDYRRRPKHIYETAFFCSRGDRLISQVRNDVFSCGPSKQKEGHLSAKPQEMLEYFLSMICGSETDFLDPTCGSGTSVRAAARLGANSALGLEIDPTMADNSAYKLETQLLQPPEEEVA